MKEKIKKVGNHPMKELDIGNSDFKSIIENNHYYIDKSLFIKEVIKTQNQVLLIPRPRRFGKTINLLMLKYFFEKDKPENEKLFTHLKIWQTEKEILERRGKYPVIFLSFKDAKENTWEKCLELIISEIAILYSNHKYLLDSDVLETEESNLFHQIKNRTAKETDYQRSLKNLSDYLYRYHKERVVILVDEYDTPIQHGYKKYYDDAITFMRNLLSGAYKDNTYLYKGVITGILRVSSCSPTINGGVYSSLNNIGVYTILEQEFADKFGFTEEEVKQVLSDLQIPTSYNEIKKWYDGYTIGNQTDIYNPWSILNYAVGYRNGFKSHWVNTSSDSLLKDSIKPKNSDYYKEIIHKLIVGDSIQKELDENFIFPDMETNKDLLWTLLTFSGYLTVNRKVTRKVYELSIPNYELRTVFQDIILYWFTNEVKIIRNLLEDTANYLVNNNLPKFAEGFKQIIGDTFSYYDIDGTPEKIYQAYTLGLLAILSDDYIIRSNRESGEGRYDILLIPRTSSTTEIRNGVIMELKQIELKKRESKKKLQERVAKALKDAMKQIEEKQYYKELLEHKVANIIKVPVVFVGKEVYL